MFQLSRLARNAREAIAGVLDEPPDLMLIDQGLADVGPQHWREAWARLREPMRLVAFAGDEADAETVPFFWDVADLMRPPPLTICAPSAARYARAWGTRSSLRLRADGLLAQQGRPRYD